MSHQVNKILIIRMLGLGDVTCIGIPSIRYFKVLYPNASLSFLTFGTGKELMQIAEPDLDVWGPNNDEWPDNILPAMEMFMGLGDAVIDKNYDLIVNLDTWFMPCFLTRYLADAGEPTLGNMMSISVKALVEQFKHQTLAADYVNHPYNYITSTFSEMDAWHHAWWQQENPPLMGYPEFYLRHCCGFSDIALDMHIDVTTSCVQKGIESGRKIIALATEARTPERNYPHATALKHLLEKYGYDVWTGFDGSVSLRQTLQSLKSSHLLITVPSAPQWLAKAVGCESLVICGDVDYRTLMPEYHLSMPTPPSPDVVIEKVNDIFRKRLALH